jgi:hypothetical protein
MNVMRHVYLLVLTLACASVHAQSIVPNLEQQGRKGDVARTLKEQSVARFDKADEDKDGKLSREEVGKHFRYMAENFDKLDVNKDGFLSWEEFVGHNRWPK